MPFNIDDKHNYGSFTISFGHVDGSTKPHMFVQKNTGMSRPKYAVSISDAYLLNEPETLIEAAVKAAAWTKLVDIEMPVVWVSDLKKGMFIIDALKIHKKTILKLANAMLDCVQDLCKMPNNLAKKELPEGVEISIKH